MVTDRHSVLFDKREHVERAAIDSVNPPAGLKVESCYGYHRDKEFIKSNSLIAVP